MFRKATISATGAIAAALIGFISPAQGGILTLDNTFALSNLLAAPPSNFHPQGLGYDTGANELLFIQQSTDTIYRTDLTGSITGSRTIGTITINAVGGTFPSAPFTTSVAGDGSYYYFTDYICNTSCYDLHRIGKSSGTSTNISSEIAGYGGYPIDVRGGNLYRTEASTSYSWAGLNQIRISSVATPETVLQTVNLATGSGIGDMAVDSARNNVWVIDYSAVASLRRFDLTTGNLLDSFALGLDGLTAGLTYADDKLYYYDWNSGSGSTLSVYSLSGFDVPEPGTLALFGLGLAGLGFARRRKAA